MGTGNKVRNPMMTCTTRLKVERILLNSSKTCHPRDSWFLFLIPDFYFRNRILHLSWLTNSFLVMETLPIFLEQIVPSYVAIILSVTGVLFFGEYEIFICLIKGALTCFENSLDFLLYYLSFISIIK
jgi:hypothetical protein